MTDLSGKTIPFEQPCPGSCPYGLNTCFNPDCRSHGVPPIYRKAVFKKLREANATAEEMDAARAKQPGRYSIHAGEETHRRTGETRKARRSRSRFSLAVASSG